MLEELMPALRLVLERERHRLSTKTAKILEVLSGSQTLSGPMLYQRVMRDIRELQRMWENHRAELAEVVRKVPQNAPDRARQGFPVLTRRAARARMSAAARARRAPVVRSRLRL